MRDFLKSTSFKILLAFLAFLVGMMIYAVTKGGYSVSGASVINTLTKPLRAATNGFSMKLESTMDKLHNSEEYYLENQELKSEINRLKKELSEYEDLKSEVEELRKFVVIKEENPDMEISQPAEVLGYVTNDPFKSFTIDRGTADGIEPYCPVATAQGIVGMTVEVGEHTSTVRSILSPDLSIAVVCASTGTDFGIIEGTVLTAEKGNTKLIHLGKDNKLRTGDLMVTAGNSGLFPKDYPVGTIKKLGFEDNGLSACAEVKPCADITRLSSVIVITDFRGKKGESDED